MERGPQTADYPPSAAVAFVCSSALLHLRQMSKTVSASQSTFLFPRLWEAHPVVWHGSGMPMAAGHCFGTPRDKSKRDVRIRLAVNHALRSTSLPRQAGNP
jgi:hypothetical protein